jgi:hypothetical protein
MSTISIKGDAGLIDIRVFGYERFNAEDVSDSNWLSCEVFLDLPPYRGSFDCPLTTKGLKRFRDDVALGLSLLSGDATLTQDEELIKIKIQFVGLGKVSIEGKFVIFGPPQTDFKFIFESDQSYIQETHVKLVDICNEFPVKN